MTTTFPNIPFDALKNNIWFWLGILAVVLLLYFAFAMGELKGIKEK